MPNPNPITRRTAMLAGGATAIGLTLGDPESTRAEQPGPGSPHQHDQAAQEPIALEITLTDGQVIALKANRVVIDRGHRAKLVLTAGPGSHRTGHDHDSQPGHDHGHSEKPSG